MALLKGSVAIVQRVAPHYRHAFYRGLHAELENHGIELEVYYGSERPGTVPRTVILTEPWAHLVTNKYIVIGGRDIVWQRLPFLCSYNLVIVEHAARILNNYSLLTAHRLGLIRKLAFWGHGGNFQQGKSRPVAELIKSIVARQADHYFAYTELSRQRVSASGVPDERITVVNNTIDTAALTEALDSITSTDLTRLRARHGLHGEHVAIYCGGLYPEKRIDFLIKSVLVVRQRICDFELIIIGDGPDADIVRNASAEHRWIKYIGPKFGSDVAPYYRLSRCILMPYLVGLVIIDSFTAELPLITTDHDTHGPEIAYLKNNINGLMVTPTIGEYAGAVVSCLSDDKHLKRLQEGCRDSASELALDNMIKKYTEGILLCMKH